jgi:2-amino-4-hydroxy-6-hydroxymethyldihydropteridine diphosphokinase
MQRPKSAAAAAALAQPNLQMERHLMAPNRTPEAVAADASTDASIDAFIGLGANLGTPQQAVLDAIAAIAQIDGVEVLKRSSLYGSAPVDAGGPDFVNAVLHIRTRLTALEIFQQLQGIEQQAGRQRPFRNAPRTLDLDLLLYGNTEIHSAELTVPHPRMWQRAFVVRPLAELAPALVSDAQLQAVAGQDIWLLNANGGAS